MLLSLVGGRVTLKESDGVLIMLRMTGLVYDHDEVKTEVIASVMELRALREKIFIIFKCNVMLNVMKKKNITKH